jgi:predicted RNase H-like nuclease (RuvC/YqgF family)
LKHGLISALQPLLRVEITRLTGSATELKTEIQETHMKIERLEFRRGLERQYWASKLRAKRRRVHRMRSHLESKHAKMERAQAHLLETKRS